MLLRLRGGRSILLEGAAHGRTPPGPRRLRPRDRSRHRRRGTPPGRRRRDDPVGELHLPRGAGRAGLGADQQIRRGLSRAALLRRPGVHRRDRAHRARPRLRPLPRRARQRAAALGLADEPGGLFRLLEARRHGAGHGPHPRRPPDPRRAGLAHGQGVQLRPLQDLPRPGRRDRLRRADADGEGDAAEDGALRLLLLSARLRLCRVQGGRRRGRARFTMADISHIGGLVAAGRYAQPVRRRLRRRDHHHPQDPARAARRPDPGEEGARFADRRGRLPRPAGRPAHEQRRRRRHNLQESRRAGVPRLCRTDAYERRACSPRR